MMESTWFVLLLRKRLKTQEIVIVFTLKPPVLLKYLKLLLYNKVYAIFCLLLRLKRTNIEILCKKTW